MDSTRPIQQTYNTVVASALTLALAAICGLACPRLHSATVELTPAADAELREASALAAFGTGTSMVSGGLGSNAGNTLRRALLRFDFADQIPPGSSITQVELTARVVLMLPPTPVPSDFGLHRLLRPWNESTVTWTWTDGPTAPWGTAGASRDDDAQPTASATVPVTGLGTYTFLSTPELVADVQHWLDNPEANAGWLLRSGSELPFTARHFGTREGGANAARLTVHFEAATTVEPVIIEEISVVEGDFTFTFTALPGTAYRVEFRQDLNDAPWQIIEQFPPTTAPEQITFRHPQQGTAGIYRVESSAAP